VKVVVFGATGMIGQGVVRECLADAGIDAVLSIGRSPAGVNHPKFTENLHPNLIDELLDPTSIQAEITGTDAVFFCLGVPSARMSEADYRRITQDLTLSVATAMATSNPGSTFVYVSGEGADSTERGRVMWARVRGATENALLAKPDLNTYIVRPGIVQPRNGAASKVALYRWGYRIATPLFPILRKLAPKLVTSTEHIGRAMIALARSGNPDRILRNHQVNAIAEGKQGL
jgi:uncharacterized protein YbjT (DUF2867 family)